VNVDALPPAITGKWVHGAAKIADETGAERAQINA